MSGWAAAIQQEKNELEIIPLSPIGAEVRGIRLSGAYLRIRHGWRELRKAFTDHSVLAFRIKAGCASR